MIEINVTGSLNPKQDRIQAFSKYESGSATLAAVPDDVLAGLLPLLQVAPPAQLLLVREHEATQYVRNF